MKKGLRKEQNGPAVSNFSIGVIYFAQAENADYPLLENLMNANRNYDIIVVAKSNSESLNRWKEQGKIQICSVADLKSTLASSQADYWLAADEQVSWNIAKSLAGLHPEKGTDLYLPGTVRVDGNKPGLAQILSRIYYSKLQAFFSPSTYQNSVWKAFIIGKEALLSCLQYGESKNVLEIYHRICSIEQDYGEFELVAPKYPAYVKEANTTAKAGVSHYIKWFFKDAWQQMRDGEAGFTKRLQGFSRFFFASLFLLCLVGMPILSFDYGISWDEKLQYEYAHDIYAYLTSFGEDRSIFDFGTHSALWQPMQYYGSFFDVLTVAINDLFGIENEFEMRHFLNAIFGVFGLLYAGLFARAISKNWFTALLTFIFLLLTPSYFGHSMFNPKDIPFATGFYMAMYYMVHFIRELPNPRFSTILMLILGIALSISIRVGGILIFPYILLFGGVKWLNLFSKKDQKPFQQLKGYLLYFIPVVIGGYFLGLIFWPYAIEDPIHNPLNALKGLSNVNYTTSYETFEGIRTYMSQVPWYYSLKWIAIGSPVIMLLGAAIQVIRIPFDRKNTGWNLMLVFMFLFPLLYAAYKESMLYNGWRHWFFVYVNLVVLGAWGWTWVIENKQKWMRYTGIVLVAVGVADMTVWMIKSHPNQYIYFNELEGGIQGAYGYYETDYYSNTMRQAVEWFVENELPKTNGKAITILTNNEPLTGQYYMNKYTDSVNIMWTREYELTKKPGDYSFFTSRTMSKTTLLDGYWPPKGTIHTIDLDGVPLMAIVKHENSYMSDGYASLEVNDLNGSVENFYKATRYDPGNEEAWRMLGMSLANKGPAYSDSAIHMLQKGVEVLPEAFICYDMMGMIYASQNRYDTAATLFKKAIGYKINYTNAHYNLGVAYYNLSDFGHAADEFTNCVKYGGQQTQYYKLLGLSKIGLNQLDDAIQYLTYVIQKTSDPDAYEYLGKAYELKGNKEAAQQMYQRAQQMRQ